MPALRTATQSNVWRGSVSNDARKLHESQRGGTRWRRTGVLSGEEREHAGR